MLPCRAGYGQQLTHIETLTPVAKQSKKFRENYAELALTKVPSVDTTRPEYHKDDPDGGNQRRGNRISGSDSLFRDGSFTMPKEILLKSSFAAADIVGGRMRVETWRRRILLIYVVS